MAVIWLILAASAFAQNDPGLADTVKVDSISVVLGTPTIVPVTFVNDEPLVGIEVTLTTDFPSLVLDSFSFVGSRVEYLTTRGWVNDTSGVAMTIYCFPTDEPVIPSGQGLLGHFFVTNPDLSTTRQVRIDTTSIEIDLVFRTTMFSDTIVNSFVPQFQPGVIDYRASCCMGETRGNVNYDDQDQVDISDLTFLVNALFVLPGEQIPECNVEANINGSSDGFVDISDLTYLVNYLFIDSDNYPLVPCPVTTP